MIVEVAPDELGHVLFTTGGTEAIEHAVRMARLHNGRPKVLAAYRSYHGSTTTSIHLTGDPRRWASDTGAAGAVHSSAPSFTARRSDRPHRGRVRASARTSRAGDPSRRPVDISALVLEPVTAARGSRAADRDRAGPEFCTHHGIVFIADEVLVGFGRTGAWFGVDHDGVAPDLMVFAKGVNSGYVPLGGVLVGDPIYETFTQRPYPAGMTYSGHPLACAAAVGAIGAMHDEGTVAAAARLGTDTLGPGLEKLPENHPSVGDVRGIGGLWTVELVRDGRPRSRSWRWAPPARRTRR